MSVVRDRDDKDCSHRDLTRVALSWRLGEYVGKERPKEGFFIEVKTPKATVADLYGTQTGTEIMLFSCRDAAALS